MADPEEQTTLLSYYVHGFTDPTTRAHRMNETPPRDETPQTDTCRGCAGPEPLQYVFTADRPTPRLLELDLAASGSFVFWIRAYQPSSGLPVPPGPTRVSFSLGLVDGPTLATGEVSKNVTAVTPAKFEARLNPNMDSIPGGSILRWRVAIASTGGGYNPAAAPYGVSADFPFSVSLPILLPIQDVTLVLTSPGSRIANATTGESFAFEFSLQNRGSRTSQVSLGLEGLSGSGIEARIQRDDGSPWKGPQPLDPDATARLRLVVDAKREGLWGIVVAATGSRDEKSYIGFLGRVSPLAATSLPPTPSGTPRADGMCAGTTVPGREPITAFSTAFFSPTSVTFSCAVDPAHPSTLATIRVALLKGRITFSFVGDDGQLLGSRTVAGSVSLNQTVFADGPWRIVVRLEGFEGGVSVDLASPAGESGAPTPTPRPSTQLVLASVALLALAALLVVGWVILRLRTRPP